MTSSYRDPAEVVNLVEPFVDVNDSSFHDPNAQMDEACDGETRSYPFYDYSSKPPGDNVKLL